MQNAGPPYQGPAAPSVNYSDHSYDNQIGAHCQPSGYQPPYHPNNPYHPVASPRPHHYGNHQMQQGMPYGHHGPYAPTQNQYGPGANQELYRNHHSAYMGGNNRNMPGKPVWGAENPPDMMQPYNHVSPHPQMINNPPPMNVSSMRSPPHVPSIINPAPSPGPQHYRQLQSPGHSPHSWPQAQIPSPGILHSTRTTPSPLSTHSRSPGHNQPFSPPAAHLSSAVNLQTHGIPSAVPENGQPPSAANKPSGNDNASNPLHSLQKMVMLEPDTKSNLIQINCEMSNENCDPMSSQPPNHMLGAPQNTSNESKDSSYSTYFNLDENRFESEPQCSTPKSTVFSPVPSVQQVSGCNFEMSTPMSDSPNVVTKSEPIDQVNVASLPVQASSFPVPLSPSDSVSPKPAIESVVAEKIPAPEQSLNSVQASESISKEEPVCATVPDQIPDTVEKETFANSAPAEHDANNIIVSLNSSIPLENTSNNALPQSNTAEVDFDIKVAKSEVETNEKKDTECDSSCTSGLTVENTNVKNEFNSTDTDKCMLQNTDRSENKKPCSIEKTLPEQDENQDCKPPSIIKLTVAANCIGLETTDVKSEIEDVCRKENNLGESSNATGKVLEMPVQMTPKLNLRKRKGVSYEESPSEEQESKANSFTSDAKSQKKTQSDVQVLEQKKPKKSLSPDKSSKKCDLLSITKPRPELARNPVKVVIHRIRTSDTNDTWHVPKPNTNSLTGAQDKNKTGNSCDGDKTKVSPRISNIGPQIIILSPAMSRKKFGITTSNSPKSVITIQKDKPVVETASSKIVSDVSLKLSERKQSARNSPKKNSLDADNKKRGRPVGSRNKSKTSPAKKKSKLKGNNKKRKPEVLDVEVVAKIKKTKLFGGPYIRITGSKQSPSSITVVNVAPKEEEKGTKNQKPKNNFNSSERRLRVGHTSTLSPHYDAFNKDKTWLCAFCQKGSHWHGLGDLYGPYFINDDKISDNSSPPQCTPSLSTNESASPQSSSRGTRSKRKRSEVVEESPKLSPSKKSKQFSKTLVTTIQASATETSPSTSQCKNLSASENPQVPSLKEVWIHEDCAVWCQGISLMGSTVHGLEEAIQEATDNICSCCKLLGATLGCWSKGCKEQYHFSCAKEKDCQMDIENFSLLCPKHQQNVRQTDKRKKSQ